MPSVSNSNLVLTSAQILDGIITDADVNAAAAIAYSKLNLALGIVNADVSGTAAIVDTKLNTISTAGKVSGAALTSLASIPAGAGIIPAANLSVGIFKNGTTSKSASDASTTQNIAHGIGATPKYVRLTAFCSLESATVGPFITMAVYNGTTQSAIRLGPNSSTYTEDTAFTLDTDMNVGTESQTGVITFDGTNIIITWTKTGSPTGTYQILWEAFA